MFDLITGKAHHLPSHSTLPIMVSTTAQAVVAVVAVMVPALFIAEKIPRIPTMLAFVAPAPSPPPPPAPAPRAAQPSAPTKTVAHNQPVPSAPKVVNPAEVPRSIEADLAGAPSLNEEVAGGIDGGVPGGIVGGMVGGVPEPPPPPPPVAEAPPPIRIGGAIQSPKLLHRVEPLYPPIAISARMQGLVILETLVDLDGNVEGVKVLRSAGSVLDREALAAVRQWRYAPLILNGRPLRFLVTVILSFSVEGAT